MAQTLFSGFCQMAPLVINGSGSNSPIGEINNLGLTYAKEPDRYFDSNGVSELIILRGVSGTAQHEQIPKSHQAPVLQICDWLYSQADAGKLDASSQITLQALIAQFSDMAIFKDIGVMKTDGRVWLPASLYFSVTVETVVHEFKLWFAIENLLNEFPYRDIYVFGPVPPTEIDILLTYNYKELAARFAEETAARLQARIDGLLDSNKYPYSSRQVVSFDIYDQINKPYATVGDWTVILYGNPLNADEDINEAIKKLPPEPPLFFP